MPAGHADLPGLLTRGSLSTAVMMVLAAPVDAAQRIVRPGRDDRPGQPEVVVDRLLDGLEELGEQVLLVLDDAHQLDDGGVAWVCQLVSGTANPHRLLTITRPVGENQHRAFLAAADNLLTAKDLAFDADGVKWLLQARHGRPPGPQEAAGIVRPTGGWSAT